MNRLDFQALARVRLAEARALLDAGLPDGAYYLCGYAVECALKACIARKTQRHDFPPRPDEVRRMYMHTLVDLVKLADLEADLREARRDRRFEEHWALVQQRSEQTRYRRTSTSEAQSLLQSVVDRKHGELRWIRRHR